MELDCGIPERRIVTWLDDELALARAAGCWTFTADSGASCRIATQELERRPLGAVFIERTLVTITGDADAINDFYRLFTLRFISAGG